MNKLIIKGLSRLRILNKANITARTKINNIYFEIPILKGNGRQNLSEAEPWMLEVLKKLLVNYKGSFIDVGINVGQTLLKVKSINKQINYFGFEPNPICIYYLSELINLNKIENVIIFPVALSDHTDILELMFYDHAETDPSASIISDFRPWEKVIKKSFISSFPVSSFRKYIDFKEVGIIKIDVEGAELEVLKGLDNCIQVSRCFILIEILPSYNAENKDRLRRQLEIEVILENLNYDIYRIIKSNKNHFSHFQKIDKIGIHNNNNWCDYLLCPREKTIHLN